MWKGGLNATNWPDSSSSHLYTNKGNKNRVHTLRRQTATSVTKFGINLFWALFDAAVLWSPAFLKICGMQVSVFLGMTESQTRVDRPKSPDSKLPHGCL